MEAEDKLETKDRILLLMCTKSDSGSKVEHDYSNVPTKVIADVFIRKEGMTWRNIEQRLKTLISLGFIEKVAVPPKKGNVSRNSYFKIKSTKAVYKSIVRYFANKQQLHHFLGTDYATRVGRDIINKRLSDLIRSHERKRLSEIGFGLINYVLSSPSALKVVLFTNDKQLKHLMEFLDTNYCLTNLETMRYLLTSAFILDDLMYEQYGYNMENGFVPYTLPPKQEMIKKRMSKESNLQFQRYLLVSGFRSFMTPKSIKRQMRRKDERDTKKNLESQIEYMLDYVDRKYYIKLREALLHPSKAQRMMLVKDTPLTVDDKEMVMDIRMTLDICADDEKRVGWRKTLKEMLDKRLKEVKIKK